MTAREAQRRDRQSQTDHGRNASMSVAEWCRHRRVSRGLLYKLWKEDKGPKWFHIGTRRFISEEADAEWLAEREAEAVA
jgi:hypothetical protein